MSIHNGTPPEGPAGEQVLRTRFVPVPIFFRLAMLAVLGLLEIVVLAVAVLSLRENSFNWVAPALAVLIVLHALPLVLYRSSFGWFHPLVFGAILYLLSLSRNLGLYIGGVHAHAALPGYGQQALAELAAFGLVLQCVGLLAYYAGFFCFPAPVPPAWLRFRRPRNLRLKVVAAVAFSVVVLFGYLQSQGGLIAHLLSWGLGRSQSLAGEFYVVPLITVGALACILWLSYDLRVYRRPVFWACALTSLVASFLATGSRATLVGYVIVALVVFMMRRRRVVYGRVAIAAVACLLLLSVLGQFRRSMWGGMSTGEIDWGSLTERSPAEHLQDFVTGELTARNTSGSPLLPILARVPHEVDLLYGSSYLAVVTLVVPRGVWEGKPGLVDGRVGRTFFNSSAGFPPGAVGEAYWNFHVPGVVLVFLLFGIFHRFLVRLVEKYPEEPAVLALFAMSLWFLRAPTGPAVVALLMRAAPLIALAVAWGVLSRGRWRRRSPERLPPPAPSALEGQT